MDNRNLEGDFQGEWKLCPGKYLQIQRKTLSRSRFHMFFKANVYLPGVVIQNPCCIFLAKPQEWVRTKVVHEVENEKNKHVVKCIYNGHHWQLDMKNNQQKLKGSCLMLEKESPKLKGRCLQNMLQLIFCDQDFRKTLPKDLFLPKTPLYRMTSAPVCWIINQLNLKIPHSPEKKFQEKSPKKFQKKFQHS